MYRLGPLELIIVALICLFLLAVLGALVFLAIRAMRTRPATPVAPPDAMKKCPYCAEEIKADAIVCRYCGRDLPPVSGQS